MRWCCRKLLHCRADTSGSSTQPAWNAAILTTPYAIFHTSGLKRIWGYSITLPPQQIEQTLQDFLWYWCWKQRNEWKGKIDHRRTLMAGLSCLSLHLIWISHRIKAQRETWFLICLTTSSPPCYCYSPVKQSLYLIKHHVCAKSWMREKNKNNKNKSQYKNKTMPI